MQFGNLAFEVEASILVCKETVVQTSRFDAIAAELARLSAEIEAINRQPLVTRIDLRPQKKEKEADERVSISQG